ncbi:LemA family protein [Kiritimatiellota bacterium B12222]|nr:LemA family protein [Kiritimatiellota bacterium B12222]
MVQNLMDAESGLSGTLGKLMMVVEDYPDLNAHQNIAQLSEELTRTEDQLSLARQHNKHSVMNDNTQIEVFPSVIIAHMFHFDQASSFEMTDENEKDRPEVSFG